MAIDKKTGKRKPIGKAAKELYDLARLKNGGKVEKAQWSGNAQRLVPPIYDVKNK